MACRVSEPADPVLPYNQSAAMLSFAKEDASRLPDIPHYDIELEVNIEDASYRGSAVIDYTNLEDVTLESLFSVISKWRRDIWRRFSGGIFSKNQRP